MKRVALVGYGAIGRSIAGRLLQSPTTEVELTAVCMREHQLTLGRFELPPHVLATSRLEEMLAKLPDIVVEAASHAAVAECGATVLDRGCELFVLSAGALAVDELRELMITRARRNGGRISIPCGALAGFDGLLSLREAGLTAVTYRSTKPPAAWRGTEAEGIVDLGNLQQPCVIFSGSAREAALRFPKNANLAVAVALAGVGLETTRVELVADPHCVGNAGYLLAQGRNSELEVRLTNSAFENNPKTSEITGLSVVAALANRSAVIRYE